MDANKYGDYIRKLEFLEKRKKDPKEEASEINEKRIKTVLMKINKFISIAFRN